MEENKQKNYYEILEIPVNSSPEGIHQGYVAAKNAYSGDSLALYSLLSKEECDHILSLVDEAYTVLSDPEKRRLYDHARGFNMETAAPQQTNVRFAAPPSYNKSSAYMTPAAEVFSAQQPSENSLQKLVANKRYALQYPVDPEMEKKIEQTTEFTGAFLKEVREYKNVDIIRMSEMTKVSKTYLLGLEADDFDNLPAVVYVRGFVYQYAKCLKLNPDLVASSYVYRLKKAREKK